MSAILSWLGQVLLSLALKFLEKEAVNLYNELKADLSNEKAAKDYAKAKTRKDKINAALDILNGSSGSSGS